MIRSRDRAGCIAAVPASFLPPSTPTTVPLGTVGQLACFPCCPTLLSSRSLPPRLPVVLNGAAVVDGERWRPC